MKKEIIRKIYLLSKRQPMKPIEVVQYETGVQLVFEVQDIELDNSATVTLFVRKPSGKFVFQEDNISLTGNTVVIDLHNQAITEYGNPFFQIKFKNGEEIISTYSGMLTVEKSLEDSGAEESKTVIAAFGELTDEQISRIEEATRVQIDLMKAEVEAKGETVLATIPEDYTEMYNRVNTLANSVANAIKGTVSGSVVRVDDVSPVEHSPVVKVYGKNLFNKEAYADIEGVVGFDISRLVVGKIYTISSNLPLTWLKVSNKGYGYASVTKNNVDGFTSFTFEMKKHENINTGTKQHMFLGIATDIPDANAVTDVSVLGGYNIQIEEGTTATEYTPYIDPTTVTVRRCGKNILPLNYLDGLERVHNGITFTVQGDGGIKAVGTATEYAYFKLMNTDISKVPYVATDCLFDNDNKLTFIPVQSGVTVNKVFYPQIEIGTVATDYEPYKEPTEHTPSSDGIVEGITSLSPVMTLLTDTEGVTIECEYIKDTNKVINNLAKAVVALGGAV